jgi:hypothetical protein
LDKLIHFAVCAIVAAIVPSFFSVDSVVGFTVGLSVGKEVGDYMNYGQDVGNKEFAKMAAGDLLADGLGIAAGLAIREFWEE